ncbi:hypothetical protein J7384_13755 [Endozoicomonas sp. G2_1]|uniref:DUF6641 family protein n=1 Tax=Endozoicomonas sp. G2_1 TaxID=2821091 RepID=UPI001AD96CE2|nr:DUF6641 family protein [Endozoicomonas sp. G2_1]MBO9491427.1 hypothetical protein [Endozoicomonas sp. G2_1]
MPSLLSKLNITERPIFDRHDPIQQRQRKLLERLEEQREVARCYIENEVFTAYREKWVDDPKTGEKKKARIPRKVKPWFNKIKGQLYLEIRYGSVPIELQRKKYAIAVEDKSKLLEVIDTVIQAVSSGELDEAITDIVNKRKK